MMHVVPHWNWVRAHTSNVWAYTNAAEVELFLNGASLGAKQKPEQVSHLMWRVGYTPGTLRAVARTGGRGVGTQEGETAGGPAPVGAAPRPGGGTPGVHRLACHDGS